MRIVNAMFGRKKGGIEQAFVDYSKCLADLGCEVIALAYQDAQILNSLPENITTKTITNFGQWDPLATWKLKKLIRDLNPDIIITHGNRASMLLNKAVTEVPIVGVCHNYNAKQIEGFDSLITVTSDLKKTLVKKGTDESKIYVVPNMVYVPSNMPERDFTFRDPPIIGTMGRFVAKKGFNVFLKALSILRSRGVNFKAVLGGAGTELENLKKMAKAGGIEDRVSFPGWIEDKEEFFKSIDIFCLPSLHEPFGIVLLEAFIHSVPVVTTDTEGPIEIARPHIDALMIEAGDANALADAFDKFLRNPKFAERVAREGFKTVTTTYDSKMVGKLLYSILEKIINKSKPIQKEAVKAVETV